MEETKYYTEAQLIDMIQFAFDRFFGSKTTDQAVRNCIRDWQNESRVKTKGEA